MQLKKAPYAALGTGHLAFESAQRVWSKARRTKRSDFEGTYESLSKRGEQVVSRIQRSKPAKRAAEGTRQATRQLKGAATSFRKALGLEEQQTRSSRKAS
jgi:FixJ family two-component response regulator